MSDVGVMMDCSTGQQTVAPLTAAEQTRRDQQTAQADADRAARDAAETVRKNAVKQLKAQARANGKVDATVIAQMLGIDPNAPDPAQPA
jgi:hypothetical protein